MVKASDVGRPLGAFTTHRSPLGLSFDTSNTLAGRYRGGAFILDLQRTGTGYDVRAQSLVCGFLNPIDTEIWNGRLYVLEFGGGGTVWEITTPPAEPAGRRPCTNVPR